MTHEAHPVDTLLRAAVIDPRPSYADVLKARQALDAAIAAETAPPLRAPARPSWREGWWRRVGTAAAGLAVLVAAVVVSGLLAPEPVTALGELATIAERREAVAAAEGEFAYSRASGVSTQVVDGEDIGLPRGEVVAFLLPFERERWTGSDGDYFEREVIGEPEFFNEDAAVAFAASGRAEDFFIGTVQEGEYEGGESILERRVWPTDAGDLATAMRSWVSNEGNPLPETAALVELAAELLRETGAQPELRAAILEVLDELALETVVNEQDQRTTVGIQFVDGEVIRLELQFDADANLVAERKIWVNDVPQFGATAGTVFEQVEYSPVRLVSSIDGS